MSGLRHTGGLTAEQLRDKVVSLGGDSFRGELNAAMAATALREMLRGFRESRDPYGRAWAPVERTTRKGLPGKPLVRTGNLRASSTVGVTRDGFTVGDSADYAIFHQQERRRGGRLRRSARKLFGRKPAYGGIRRRMMIPTKEDGGLGLWKRPLDATARAVWRRWSRR